MLRKQNKKGTPQDNRNMKDNSRKAAIFLSVFHGNSSLQIVKNPNFFG